MGASPIGSAAPLTKRVMGFVEVLGPDEQFGSTDSWVHSARIVSPDHAVNTDLVQNALRYLGIGGGPEHRNRNQP